MKVSMSGQNDKKERKQKDKYVSISHTLTKLFSITLTHNERIIENQCLDKKTKRRKGKKTNIT